MVAAVGWVRVVGQQLPCCMPFPYLPIMWASSLKTYLCLSPIRVGALQKFTKPLFKQDSRALSLFSSRDNPIHRLPLEITAKGEASLERGSPWVFKSDVRPSAELLQHSPCLVNVVNTSRENLGVAMYNHHSELSARIFSKNQEISIDKYFFADRLAAAQSLRMKFFSEPFYRVVNAEADGLPGVIIDRYDDVACLQVNIAGIDALLPALVSAMEIILQTKTIILRKDSLVRRLEKVPRSREVCLGQYLSPTEIRENGITFFVDVFNGQKTGWFYDHRDNRALLASYCKRKRVLDLYSYIGGFGIQAAVYGAAHVVCVDSSLLAITLGKQSAQANLVEEKVTFVHATVDQFVAAYKPASLLTEMGSSESFIMHGQKQVELPSRSHGQSSNASENYSSVTASSMALAGDETTTKVHLLNESKHEYFPSSRKSTVSLPLTALVSAMPHFDVIIVDPPPLARSLANRKGALRIYIQLASQAANLLSPSGLLFMASCSSCLSLEDIVDSTRIGLASAGRSAVILQEGNISCDHPSHAALPETRYLRSVLFFVK